MFEKLMLGVMTLFMTCEAFAVQLSPQEALSRMNNTQSQSKGIVSTNSAVQLAYTSSYKGINTYYVFNKDTNDGYIILSADDCMPAVLGVVDRGSFDINNIPDNMKWWLSQYDTSISSYASKGKKYVSSATITSSKRKLYLSTRDLLISLHTGPSNSYLKSFSPSIGLSS